MQKAHDAAKNDFWHNRPDTSSPITETELNRIETNIDTIDDRVVTFDITKANQSDLLTCVSGISLNTTTGILTITLKNGTTSTLDTGLAKLAINFDYDDDPTSAHYQQIILEMKDGTYKYIDLSALITQYEFVNTSTIVWTIESDGKIKANVPDGSITAEKLQPNYLADVTSQANRATGAVTSTEANRLEAEGFAKGTQNGQPVGVDSPYYENNAKFYRDGARAIVGGKVDTWNGRNGMVVPLDGDYDISQIAPGSGATEGQVPIVTNVGTEQDPSYKLQLGNVSTDPMNYYAECSTAASTNDKTVTINGYSEYKDGHVVTVHFQNAINNGTITLNINGLGAKTIYGTRGASGTTSGLKNLISSDSYVSLLYKAGAFYIISDTTTRFWYSEQKTLAAGTTQETFWGVFPSNASAYFYSRISIKVLADKFDVVIKKIEVIDGGFNVYFKRPLKESTRIKAIATYFM